jgi:NAD(P)-dependent dehydrogenase (short-subunit alcohol dehydrogenase family)
VRPRLQGKVIVIVGGTGGLGLAAAKAFIAEGARVVIVGREQNRVESARQELGEHTLGVAGDAIDPEVAAAAVRVAAGNFGGFHGLYHVAGGSGRRHGDGPLHELTDDGWRHTLEQNLTSLFYSNRAAVRQLLESGAGGTILNMGSVLGFAPSPRFFATHAYAAAKSAVVGFTKSAASYYAPHNIRFNVIAPALVATPMSERAQADDAIMEFIKAKQPLDGGRIGRPEDLDAAAVWLMSDESRFVTGQVLSVDGGWTVSEGAAVQSKPSSEPRAAPAPGNRTSTMWRTAGRLWAQAHGKKRRSS